MIQECTMALERVQKILAQAGIASRRKAELLIRQSLVTINGKVAKLGDKAEMGRDAIKVEGKLLRFTEPPVYVAFYKPRGVISMLVDPEGRPTLADYLSKVRGRVFPVGRLDFNSEGLLLLTNDGKFAQDLQRRPDLKRVYEIKVKGRPDPELLRKLSKLERGGRVDRREIPPLTVKVLQDLTAKTKLEITVTGSGAMDLKTLLERNDFLVERMIRTTIGSIKLKELRPGEFRFLKKAEATAMLLPLTSPSPRA